MILSTYLIKIDSDIPPLLFDFLLRYVQPEKRDRILSQKKCAESMLIGDILSKYMVKKLFGIPFSEQIISYGQFGKPFLVKHPDIHFNISHSGPYVVCAVANCPVGIDIQVIAPYRLEVAKHVCSAPEIVIIESSSEPSAAFTEIWSRKEAYCKMIGIGMAYGMRDIDQGNSSIKSCRFENAYISICALQ